MPSLGEAEKTRMNFQKLWHQQQARDWRERARRYKEQGEHIEVVYFCHEKAREQDELARRATIWFYNN